MPTLSRIAPELPVTDLRRSLEFYQARLGFEVAMTMPAGDYAIVERDDVAIHLFQSAEGKTPGSIHIFTEGLDALLVELQSRGAPIHQPIALKPWGTRDFRILDNSGNEIKFTEPRSDDCSTR